MKRQFSAYLVMFSLCVSCAPKTPSIHISMPDLGPGGGHAECATKKDTSLDPAREIQYQTIDLKMQRQMVVHVDCNGHEIRRAVEKVTTPSKEIVLTPGKSTTADTLKGLGGTNYSSAYNRTTCTSSGAGNALTKIFLLPFFALQMNDDQNQSKAGHPRLRFNVNTSPTFLDMHVQKNEANFIDYEFTNCPTPPAGDAKPSAQCAKPTSVEKGTLVLTVNYTEDNLPGSKEVKDCTPNAPKEKH
jgi:hypothetical protein